jgi:hypothetical protein
MLKLAAICYSEPSVLTRATRYHIPEDGILNRHLRHSLNSYIPAPYLEASVSFSNYTWHLCCITLLTFGKVSRCSCRCAELMEIDSMETCGLVDA